MEIDKACAERDWGTTVSQQARSNDNLVGRRQALMRRALPETSDPSGAASGPTRNGSPELGSSAENRQVEGLGRDEGADRREFIGQRNHASAERGGLQDEKARTKGKMEACWNSFCLYCCLIDEEEWRDNGRRSRADISLPEAMGRGMEPRRARMAYS